MIRFKRVLKYTMVAKLVGLTVHVASLIPNHHLFLQDINLENLAVSGLNEHHGRFLFLNY